MARKGINGTHKIYKGRGRIIRRRLLLALPLVVVLLFAGAIAFFFKQGYITYTAEGFRFDFPFIHGGQTPGTAPEPPDTAPDGEKDGPSDEEEPGGEDEPAEPEDPPAEPEAEATHALEGDLTQVANEAYRGQLLALVQQTGANTVVFTVKGPNGRMMIPSDSALAAQVGSAYGDPAVTAGLQALKDAGLHLTARLSANRDNIAPRVLRDNALQTRSGAVWMDYDNITWLAPSGPQTSEYIAQLAVSCKALGFDGILLTDVGYPPRGKTNLIVTDSGADRPVLVAQMVREIRANAAGLTVAVELTDAAATALTDDATGQSVEKLKEVCDQIIMAVPSADAETVHAMRAAVETADSTCKVALSLPSAAKPADDSVFYYLHD